MNRSDTFRNWFVGTALLAIAAVILLTGRAVWRSHQQEVALAAAERAQEEPEATDTRQPDNLDELLFTWRKELLEKLETDAELNGLVEKYPLVLLHSRNRFCSGGKYRNSAFSFNNATSDEKKHGNDVQLLFDNGGPPDIFQVNMLGGQHNLVADLGPVDFDKDPDRKQFDDESWMFSAKAIARHVYLLRVRDEQGNRFDVLFKVVAVDPGSKYMAFFWRMLPGGRIVPRGSPRPQNGAVGQEHHDN